MWIICGRISIVFTVTNWVLALCRNQKSAWVALCAISFIALTLLMQYGLVLDWVNSSDWAALMDVLPSMFGAHSIRFLSIDGIYECFF